MVLSTVVPTSFVAGYSLDKTRFSFIVGHLWVAGNRNRGERWRLTIWFDCSALNLASWSCRLWYQHHSLLLTLWTKGDSGLSLGIFDYHCREQKQGGRLTSCHLILIAQHWTGIVVLPTVVPTSLAAVDSLDKTGFRCIAGHLWVAGNRNSWGRVTSCHLIWLLIIKLGSWSCQLW
jgi:hypothetical protein